MFKNILLATSAAKESDHAARVALNIASRTGSNITIFHVLGVPSRGFSRFVLDIKRDEEVEVDEDYINWVKEELKDYYCKQIKNIKSYQIKVAIGTPYREILRETRQNEYNLLILGGRHHNEEPQFKKNFLGSCTHFVNKLSSCPVLSINRLAASFWGDISNIVFITDFSEESENVFNFCLSLIKQFKSECHILKFLNLHEKILSQDQIDFKIGKNYHEMHKRYKNKLEQNGCNNFTFDVWEGESPYIGITKYIREIQADLAIINCNYNGLADSHSGISYDLEQIIARSNCPVFVANKKTKIR